ncbi:hypothetical protein GCM10022243_46930 [Saccharothrix violaceirubra]|uniref:Beta-lactamase family protein n=1 Tax=Saccharothrix violaceirubra TaxID=413306 RepID=A0A7W7T7H9_9PSEU|nr:serine hydrolase [Saccharothrix violaceirubra]MBB4967766.1 hypothetical protein [Saccharothrix violaceirubra]
MPLTRRSLFTAGAVAGGTLLLPVPRASAEPRFDGWPDWLGAHRDDVALVVDDGRGGRISHRPHAPQPLAAAAMIEHLAAYREVRPEGRVTVGDWERYLPGQDHGAALAHLGITSGNGVTADDPHALVTLDDLAGVMIRFGDTAAADLLRDRLGRPGLPSFLTERLRLVLRRPVSAQEYLADPRLQLEVIGRSPDVPGYAGRADWARDTWPGTAAAVDRTHRLLAGDALLEAGHAVPPKMAGIGVADIGRLGGALPGIVTLGVTVRWPDGRLGSATLLTRGVDEARYADRGALPDLLTRVLLDAAVLGELRDRLS